MADPKHPRKFEEGSRRQVARPCDNGKTPKDIKSEYDIGSSTLHRWIKSIHENGSTRAKDDRTPEQERVLELGRENKRLRMEVDVLKTAAPMFARRWPRYRGTPADTRYRRSARRWACRGRPTTG